LKTFLDCEKWFEHSAITFEKNYSKYLDKYFK
jgi:hypothetical protein